MINMVKVGVGGDIDASGGDGGDGGDGTRPSPPITFVYLPVAVYLAKTRDVSTPISVHYVVNTNSP